MEDFVYSDDRMLNRKSIIFKVKVVKIAPYFDGIMLEKDYTKPANPRFYGVFEFSVIIP